MILLKFISYLEFVDVVDSIAEQGVLTVLQIVHIWEMKLFNTKNKRSYIITDSTKNSDNKTSTQVMPGRDKQDGDRLLPIAILYWLQPQPCQDMINGHVTRIIPTDFQLNLYMSRQWFLNFVKKWPFLTFESLTP